MLVRNVLERRGRRPVQTIEHSEPVEAAIKRLAVATFRSLLVVDAGALVGIVTVRDLLRFLAERGARGLQARVREAMTPEPATVSPADPLDRVRSILIDRRVNHVPVVDGRSVIDVLTEADVLGEHLDDVRAFSDDLQRYIMGHHVVPG